MPLDRKDFPWLPKDWMVNGMVSDDGSVSHSFISPAGVALNSKAAVLQFLSSTDNKVDLRSDVLYLHNEVSFH